MFRELREEIVARESERVGLMSESGELKELNQLTKKQIDIVFQEQDRRNVPEKMRDKRRDYIFLAIGVIVALIAAPVWEIWIKPLVFHGG